MDPRMQEESIFKALYRCNRTIERHTNSPLADPTRLCLVSSIKVEVKKKHNSVGRKFSCFSAHLIERDLF